uniref:Uncharacterized protein n=1 Tax=Anguilla anguilla TaxID=7936 RepID=A0A0E9UAD9_ANGAN
MFTLSIFVFGPLSQQKGMVVTVDLCSCALPKIFDYLT